MIEQRQKYDTLLTGDEFFHVRDCKAEAISTSLASTIGW